MLPTLAFGDIGVYRHWCLETLVFANIGLCRGSLLADCVVYVGASLLGIAVGSQSQGGESLPRGGGNYIWMSLQKPRNLETLKHRQHKSPYSYVSMFLCFCALVASASNHAYVPASAQNFSLAYLAYYRQVVAMAEKSFAIQSALWKSGPFQAKLDRKCPSAASAVWQICACIRGCCGLRAASRQPSPLRRSLISCGSRCSPKDTAA